MFLLPKVTPEVCSVVDEFIKNVDKDFANAKDCDFYELYQALTLDTICKTGMGVDFKIQNDIENSNILKQVKVMLSFHIDLVSVVVRE